MRVIVVDDEYDILDDICQNINQYEELKLVGVYSNPLVALEEINKTKPDCAFLDIKMPGISGIELAERLLVINPKMDVVFITAFNDFATQAFEVNAMDYVLKPVHPQRLKKTIERLMNKKHEPMTGVTKEIVIRSLDHFEVLLDGKPIKWNRSKAKELMAYLFHFEGNRMTKYKICEDLWPEYEPQKALVNLQTAICSIRKSLGDVGKQDVKIEFSEESYSLKLGKVVNDVNDFEILYDRVKKNEDIEMTKKAISVFKGDYMGSEDWCWAHLTAQSLARKYEELIEILAKESFKKGQFSETVEAIMRLVTRQAVDKNIQLMLMEAAYISYGINGLSRYANSLKNIYRMEYDMELEPEATAYCIQKGVVL